MATTAELRVAEREYEAAVKRLTKAAERLTRARRLTLFPETDEDMAVSSVIVERALADSEHQAAKADVEAKGEALKLAYAELVTRGAA